MARFLATTSRGLLPALEKEMRQLGLKLITTSGSAWVFEGSWQKAYLANICLRTATRVLLPILDFPAYNNEELYSNLQRHDFTKYIGPDQTLAVEAHVADSSFRDQRFVALKTKDAIVDQFREKFGSRPDVDSKEPNLPVVVRIRKNQVSVALNLSGSSLSQRGYRLEAGAAPLREHLAAGLLQLAEWTPDKALVDPMCGSGTFLIEAAGLAAGEPAQKQQRQWPFQKWKNWNPEAWEAVWAHAEEGMANSKPRLFGSDRDPRAVKAAQANARRAQHPQIQWRQIATEDLKAPEAEPGVLVVNPPYGERMDEREKLLPQFRRLADALKKNFSGWDMWWLSGHADLTEALNMKATQKIPVWNGAIECRWVHYSIR